MLNLWDMLSLTAVFVMVGWYWLNDLGSHVQARRWAAALVDLVGGVYLLTLLIKVWAVYRGL